MGATRTKRVEVKVHGDRYPVQAPATQRAEARLHEAARLVNDRIEAIARATGEISSHRLAVMAGLDLATELLAAHDESARQRADDEVFRQAVRARSERLLGMVRSELGERRDGVTVPAGGHESGARDVDP